MAAVIVLVALIVGVRLLASIPPPAIWREPPTMPSDETILRLARAIAVSEGYYVEGSLPFRKNNPGALRLFGETDTITEFATANAGWEALFEQLRKIFRGNSAYYHDGMTIAEMARVWTGGDRPDAWARNVSSYLGVSPNTRLKELVYA